MKIATGNSIEVAQVATLARTWLERLDREGADVTMDAGSLSRIDSAGVQLLISLEKEVVRRHGSFQLLTSSPALESAFERFCLTPPGRGGQS